MADDDFQGGTNPRLASASSGTPKAKVHVPRVGTNTEVVAFASAVYTATQNTGDLENPSAKSLRLVIDVTLYAASASVVFTIQAKDVASGKYTTLLDSAAIVGTGETVLRIDPRLTASANLIAKDVLSRTYRILATHADGDAITYSVGLSLVG